MAARVNPLMRRMVLTTRTRKKFYGREFKWGSADCAKAAAFHLKPFGWEVPAPGRYASADGARRRLAELGCETMSQLIDQVGLPQIAPARVLTGDIVSFASDHLIGAIGIVLDNNLMLAFHEDAVGMAVLRMIEVERAWSVWRG
ncbi:MAG TPA: hypothetical protein VF503_01370 [Sphingobium sp.]|uniref:DUF6950 family protein n=1 Tax=Sphingobium sp. TaxID=1912891 RepID=UPI002ED53AB5